MKKKSLKKIVVSCALCLVFFRAAAVDSKTTITASVTPVSKSGEADPVFGGGYLLLDSTVTAQYVTLGGKIYYRFNTTEKWEDESQKLDVKKAYVKVRPFGTPVLELAAGKLYSYYLPGAFFSLTETYPGVTRWGKTGFGVKAEAGGFSGGIGIPLTESYTVIDDTRSFAGGISYDFATLLPEVPVKVGAAFSYDFTTTTDKKTKKETHDEQYATSFSVYYTPKLKGLVHGVSLFASYSYNAEPYVASSVFKPVTNYKSVGKAQFTSLSFKMSVGKVQFTIEGEAGKSLKADIIPFYTGMQVVIPVTQNLFFKPRFYYYAAYDTKTGSNSRDAYELYPKLTFTAGKVSANAGVDAVYSEVKDDSYEWSWTMPLSVELRLE